MGKASRDKGKRGEREVAHLFRRHGFLADRTRQSDGDVDPDVRIRSGVTGKEIGIAPEVKRRKMIAAMRWLDQAQEEAGPENLAIVFMREDGGKWAAMLDADVLVWLLESSWDE